MNFFSPAMLVPLKSRRVLLLTVAVALAYCLFQIYILNNSLINSTLVGSFSLNYKFTLLRQLVEAYFVMFTFSQVLLNIASAIFIGLNIALLLALGQRLNQSGSKQVSVGGLGLFALVSTGCPSCGLTLFSLLGPSYGVLGVFFHSLYVQASIMGILIASIIYSLYRLQQSNSCQLPLKPLLRK